MKRIAVFLAFLLLLQASFAGVLIARADSGYAGEWACVAIDMGDGIKLTEYQGADVNSLLKVVFRQDGTLTVTSMGELIPGTWQETSVGVSAVVDGEAVEFTREGSQLVNDTNGVLMYLEKAAGKPKTGGLLSLVKVSKFTGRWDAVSIDKGDGVLLTEMEGVSVSALMSFQISRDGTLELISLGEATAGTWLETADGIRVTVEGIETDMRYADGQLTAVTDGVTILFARVDGTASAAGTWQAVRYEVNGITFEAGTMFPGGCTITLSADGTGTAAVTAAYKETLTWSQKDGALTLGGSYIFTNPVLDAEKDELKLTYSSSVTVYFKRGASAAPTAAPTAEPTAMPTAVPTTSPTAEPTAVPTAEPTAVPTAPGTGGLCDTLLFTARFPAGWVFNEGWSSDAEGYSNAVYELMDAGGSKLASVTLSASSEDVSTYRDKIKSLIEYADKAGKPALNEVVIGGITFTGTEYEDWGWKYTAYAARVAEARVTLMISVEQPENITGLQAILDSIVYKLPVLTPPNVDPPLPEDGTPYSPVTAPASIGDKEITAEWVRADKSIFLDGMFDNRMALAGDTLYALAETRLSAYKLNAGSLAQSDALPGGAIKLDDDYEFISAAKDGTLYVSQGMFNILAVRGGVIADKYDLSGDLVMHPEQDWGISHWANADPMLVRVSGGELTAEPWVLSGLNDAAIRKGRFSSISCVAITDDRIYVAGNDALSGDVQRCAAFDLAGNELFSFGNTEWSADDAFGSVTGIVETNSGILVQDANMRDFKLFSRDGVFLGKADCDDLLGTDYPWLSSMLPTGDGVLVAAAQERADKSCYELLIFRIKGL
jgi:hypothetical protein